MTRLRPRGPGSFRVVPPASRVVEGLEELAFVVVLFGILFGLAIFGAPPPTP